VKLQRMESKEIYSHLSYSVQCLVCSGMCNCARCLRNRMEDSPNLSLKFDKLDLVCVVPPYLSENENARGSIYDREPRPRAAYNNETARVSPRTRHNSTTNTHLSGLSISCCPSFHLI
jgi:hypothetical protein